MAKIWYKIAKKLLFWGLTYVYNYIDKDNDGKISKEELKELYAQIKELLDKIKNRK